MPRSYLRIPNREYVGWIAAVSQTGRSTFESIVRCGWLRTTQLRFGSWEAFTTLESPIAAMNQKDDLLLHMRRKLAAADRSGSWEGNTSKNWT